MAILNGVFALLNVAFFILLTDSITLDSSVIAQKSVQVSNGNTTFIENIDFRINYFANAFINLKIPKGTQLTVKHSASNFSFSKTYQNKNPNIIVANNCL